ncbi:MAG: SAM-dependent chlorinase/fluorinase [Crocinitomicaceae bacterium]|jgi:S-adenosylmethionine hydrolase|nr:SAM-dependent chlorinase/fluorinase [Crocinitomicaceae bacterium]
MQILTLTSDTGLQDYYIASLKGAILKTMPEVQIVDISHSIQPFDVASAAFQMQCCYKDFPDGTIHLIGVDSEPLIQPPEYSDASSFVSSYPTVMKFHNQYFISNDNGFFGAFLDDQEPQELWRYTVDLKNVLELKYPMKNCFVPLAKRIIEKENLETFAEAVNKYKKALIPKAVIEEFIVRGIIIHIDSFGNLITNISKADFERLPQDAPYSIKFANEKYYIDHISETYNAVQQGERVALFNENNLLEIAINRGARQSTGGADILFGMKLGDRLRIESSPAGSRKTLLF